MSVWISATEFAKLVGVTPRMVRKALQKCHAGSTWRGVRLDVRTASGRGGVAGLVYEVAQESIPPRFIVASETPVSPSSESSEMALSAPVQGALTSAATTLHSITLGAPASVDAAALPSFSRSSVCGDPAEGPWRFAIIEPIHRATKRRSAERAEMIAEAAKASRVDWKGRSCTVSERSIRGWIAEYEAGGFHQLMRKTPETAGKRRVLVSRPWDRAMRQNVVSGDVMAETARKIRQHARSVIRSGAPSCPTAQLNMLKHVVELTRAAGVDRPDIEMRKLCQVPRAFIAAEWRYSKLAKKENDAAAYAAEEVPRITRDRSKLKPGDWVAADVHHIDILFRRPDGTDCTPKAVAWYDLATNRTRFDVFIMPKGEMIRREHVLQSFVWLLTDPNFVGVPSRLYIDRGGEYNWMELVEDIAKLKRSIDIRFGEPAGESDKFVHRARPYNPQAKVIEGLFATLERVAFAQLPGYIGGNRMRKKTANQGRAPQPYPGDETQLRKAIETAIAYYHIKPQTGHLGGLSPELKFASFVANGWRSTVLDLSELAVAFSHQFVKRVQRGGFVRLEGRDFHADELLSRAGTPVLVRQPRFGDKDTVYIFTEFGEPLGVAQPTNVYEFGDPRGAGEQSRKQKALAAQLRVLAADAPRLDPEGTLAAAVALHGEPTQAPTDGVIRLNPEFTEAARMAKEAPARAESAADRREADADAQFAILTQLGQQRRMRQAANE